MKSPKTKNILKILTVSLAVVFAAQSCNILGFGGQRQGKSITLTWWKPFDDPRYVQPLIDAYQKAHSNVQIKYVQKDVTTYESELVDALASGNGPDIFSIHNDWLPKHEDKIAPAPAAAISLRDFENNFVQVATDDLVDGGKIYAMPLAVDVLGLYYNRDILASAGIARPPATWEELVNLTPKLTRQDSTGDFTRSAVALGTAANINRAPDILGLLMLQNGTQFYDPNHQQSTMERSQKDDQGNTFSPGARALEFYTQFADPGKVTYTWNSRSNNSIEAFASGKVAMMFSYSYLRPTLAAKSPFLNYGIAPVPQIDVNQNHINYANYWAEAVSKQSPNAAVAWDFLKFITGKDVLKNYYSIQKQPSSRIDILQNQLSDPDIGVFAENALTAKSFYKPDSNAVESIFVQMIENVVLHNVAPQDAVIAASQKINLLLRNF